MKRMVDDAFAFQAKNKHHIVNHRTSDELQIRGFILSGWKALFFCLASILGCFLPWLVVLWSKKIWLKVFYTRCPLYRAQKVLLTDTHGRSYITRVITVEADGDYPTDYLIEPEKNLFINEQDHLTPLLQEPEYGVVRYFVHQNVKYLWKPSESVFERLSGIDIDSKCSDFYNLYGKGFSEADRKSRQKVYGPNAMEVAIRSYWKIALEEFINPFYLFEVFSVGVWLVDEYTYYAICILVVLVISLGTSVYERRTQNVMVHNMASVTGRGYVTILMPGQTKVVYADIPISELVPGDVMVLPKNGGEIPCDAVLLQGNCIVNESMLTGEGSPKTKTPVPYSDEYYCSDAHKRHTIYGGTDVLQTRFYGCRDSRAVVIRTGFNTVKGELLRSILHPRSIGFKFYRDSIRFLMIMGVVALIGASYCVYLFIQRGAETKEVIVRALDVLTIVIPPAMPAAVSAGTIYAAQRLKRLNVHSIAPARVNVAGKVNLVCLDKTGTLTEGSIELRGIIPAREGRFMGMVKDPRRLNSLDPVAVLLASCHCLTRIEGELMGSPLDLKMFESTGWEFEEPGMDEGRFDMLTPPVVRPPKSTLERSRMVDSDSDASEPELPKFENISSLAKPTMSFVVGDYERIPTAGLENPYDFVIDYEVGIIRQFPFSSSLQRTSVIVRTLGSRFMDIFCKGAPEKIHMLCKEETVPERFHELLRAYTARGYRVLGLAHKQLQSKITWKTVQKIEREQVETQMDFIGLLVLQNTLKPETIPVVRELRTASIRTLMITGDNLLTSISVARNCGMIPPAYQVIQVMVHPQELTKPARLEFDYAESPANLPRLEEEEEDAYHLRKEFPLSDANLVDSSGSDDSDWERPRSESPPPHEEAIKFFPCLRQPSPPAGTLSRLRSYFKDRLKLEDRYRLGTTMYNFAMDGRTWYMVRRYFPELIPRLVTRGVVFARMMPDQKTQLIEELQHLGYIVAMVGDGANDCGALKAAHVGISLSEAESSVAAPFTSKVQNISCIPTVIKEGRCALVSSFGSFKYMALYSMIQFVSVVLLYPRRTTFSDFMFLYMDLFITTTLAVVMGYTEPSSKLVPERPQGSILGIGNVVSIIAQIGLVVAAQSLGLYFLGIQQWFSPVSVEGPDPVIECWETTVIFSVSAFQYVSLAAVFSYGKPFRKPFYTNKYFVVSLVALGGFTAYLTVFPVGPVAEFFEVVPWNGTEVNNPAFDPTVDDGWYLPYLTFRVFLFALVLVYIGLAFSVEWGTGNKKMMKKFRGLFIGKSPPKNTHKIVEEEMKLSTDWPRIGVPVESNIVDVE